MTNTYHRHYTLILTLGHVDQFYTSGVLFNWQLRGLNKQQLVGRWLTRVEKWSVDPWGNNIWIKQYGSRWSNYQKPQWGSIYSNNYCQQPVGSNNCIYQNVAIQIKATTLCDNLLIAKAVTMKPKGKCNNTVWGRGQTELTYHPRSCPH